jgi:hypothetical protein
MPPYRRGYGADGKGAAESRQIVAPTSLVFVPAKRVRLTIMGADRLFFSTSVREHCDVMRVYPHGCAVMRKDIWWLDEK